MDLLDSQLKGFLMGAMKSMRPAAVGLALVVAMAAAGGLGSCSKAGDSTRAGKLLTLAAEEAGYIDVLEDRLMRQLNIAELQIQTGQKAEAIKTLNLTAATLEASQKIRDDASRTEAGKEGKPAGVQPLDEFRLIAGWTSIAELRNAADDKVQATAAYDNAVEALNSVPNVAKRASYVLSLSEIGEQLRGKEAAARLLVSGGKWAAEIKDAGTRRFALTTFTQKLIAMDDFDSAKQVMKNELDARWRSDTFMALGRREMVAEKATEVAKGYSADQARAAMSPVREQNESMQLEAKSSMRQLKTKGAYSEFNVDVRYQNGANNLRNAELQNGLVEGGR